MQLDRMLSLTEGFRTKADKMRVLERNGVPRADIARFLGVRYQQVRNTLEGDKRTGYDPDLTPQLSDEQTPQEVSASSAFRRLIMTDDELIALPADLIEIIGGEEEELYALAISDGIFVSTLDGMANRARKGLD